MNEWIQICLYTTLAGACIPIGGLVAQIERIHPAWLRTELRHFIIALGGGVLVAAVALVLIPEGTRRLETPVELMVWLIVGGGAFCVLEWWLGQRGQGGKPQLVAMLLDFAPESIALGGMFAVDSRTAPLLAVLIGLQNLPEGFNAFRELLTSNGNNRWRVLGWMTLMVPLGPALAILGRLWFADHDRVLGALMIVAAGGILYLVFQDIAPQSRLRRHWAPPLGAVIGFSLALFGQAWIEGR